MSYLLDRKRQKRKYITIGLLVFSLLLFFIFRVAIFGGLSSGANNTLTPVVEGGNTFKNKLASWGAYFSSKRALEEENENLKVERDEALAKLANTLVLVDENQKLKEILDRKSSARDLVLAGILAKPSESPFDTLLVDAGEVEGVKMGSYVFGLGDVPLGTVSEVFAHSSKIILFSNPGLRSEVLIPGKDIFVELVGRGGGNFEMILPRDFVIEEGTSITMRGLSPAVVAVVKKVISDSHDSFTKVLLVTPINVQELKFVQIEK